MVLHALIHGVFDAIPLDEVAKAEDLIRKKHSQLSEDVLRRIFSSKPLSEDDENLLVSLAKEAVQSIVSTSETDSDE